MALFPTENKHCFKTYICLLSPHLIPHLFRKHKKLWLIRTWNWVICIQFPQGLSDTTTEDFQQQKKKRIQKAILHLRLLKCAFTEVISHFSYIQLKEWCLKAGEVVQPLEARLRKKTETTIIIIYSQQRRKVSLRIQSLLKHKVKNWIDIHPKRPGSNSRSLPAPF